MLTWPTVTAVVVNYHGADHAAAAARSVAADAPAGVPLRLLVVDNSDSADEAARLRSLLPPAAELRVAPRNLGFGNGCNWALEQAPADVVWLVNPDARVLPGCTLRLLQALQHDSRLAAVAPLQYLDPAQQWLFSPAWLPTSIGLWARQRATAGSRQRARMDHAVRAETLRLWQAPAKVLPLQQRALSGSNLMLRTDCLHALPMVPGLFDPGYFMYFEDSDLCLRLRSRGLRMAVVPEAHALHLWHLSSYKDDLMAQARPRYFERHFPGSAWLARAQQMAAVPGAAGTWPAWPEEPWVVPAAWQGGWSLEVSPNEFFSPCIGRLGRGPEVAWPQAVLAAMPGVPLHARLGPLEGDEPPQYRRLGRL